MFEWRAFFENVLIVFNVLLVSYFVVGNGTYTVLMFLSIASVWMHSRRAAYEGLGPLRHSPVTPPVTVIIPASNEEDIIVGAVRSVFKTNYPGLELIVVDDGSTDLTLQRLIQTFELLEIDTIERPHLEAKPVRRYYVSPSHPQLRVLSKENGGKPDALNVGINHCRTPYFSVLDADCVLDREALLRLMRPIVCSPENMVVSGGIVRILNGCTIGKNGAVSVGLPPKGFERFQVIEYLRSFLFGRLGWDRLRATMIVSGAFAVFHLETVVEAGGFSTRTVTEDMELIVRLRRWAVQQGRTIRTSFTADPVCWSECPHGFRMLERQRRRWQLGLCQTLWMNGHMLFNPRYGAVGMLSYPFQLYVEAIGAVVEFLGYALLPVAFLVRSTLPVYYLPFLLLGLVYATFLSVGAVALEEITQHRYPGLRDLSLLLLYAALENFGYRQMVLWFRFQGVVQFLMGFRKWESVEHVGPAVMR